MNNHSDSGRRIRAVKRGAQVAFLLSILFLCFFAFGITEIGQTVLRGRTSTWEGAFAPWVYGLLPSVVLAVVGSALFISFRLKT